VTKQKRTGSHRKEFRTVRQHVRIPQPIISPEGRLIEFMDDGVAESEALVMEGMEQLMKGNRQIGVELTDMEINTGGPSVVSHAALT